MATSGQQKVTTQTSSQEKVTTQALSQQGERVTTQALSQERVTTQALSQQGVTTQAVGQQKVTTQAKRVLAMSKGRVRVPLDELGPALFNRQGQATCGKHCCELAARIIKLEGFATYRYEAGFCHEPDPADPHAVSRHGNAMADRDPLLPRLGAKHLKGVFAKTHLVTFLQLLKAGSLPDLTKYLASSQQADAQEELQDVLDHGIFMHVFPWSAVEQHREDIVALMASDNFDHGHGLSDSELRCVKAMRDALLTLPIPQAMSQWDVVRRHVERLSGQRWQEKDLVAFYDFAKTTMDVQLDLLLTVWGFAGCESEVRVDSAFFGQLAKVPAQLQWSRAALAVTHFLSDKEIDSYCSAPRSQIV